MQYRNNICTSMNQQGMILRIILGAECKLTELDLIYENSTSTNKLMMNLNMNELGAKFKGVTKTIQNLTIHKFRVVRHECASRKKTNSYPDAGPPPAPALGSGSPPPRSWGWAAALHQTVRPPRHQWLLQSCHWPHQSGWQPRPLQHTGGLKSSFQLPLVT